MRSFVWKNLLPKLFIYVELDATTYSLTLSVCPVLHDELHALLCLYEN